MDLVLQDGAVGTSHPQECILFPVTSSTQFLDTRAVKVQHQELVFKSKRKVTEEKKGSNLESFSRNNGVKSFISHMVCSFTFDPQCQGLLLCCFLFHSSSPIGSS